MNTKRVGRACLLLMAVLASDARAQTKLAGTFQIAGCEDRPAWSSFALLVDTEDFVAAADCARRTGLRWVLYLTADIYHPIDAHVVAVKARADAAGLSPHLLAVTDHEEWFEYTLGGYWPVGRLDPTRETDIWQIAALVHAWTSLRTAAIKRHWPGLPVAWITSMVNDDRRYGAFYWRPLPTGIDVIALEGYVPAWGTWATTAGRYLAHAIQTRREPIALITQGFRWGASGDWSRGPTEDQMAGTAAALTHPRVIASWLFTWDGSLWASPMVGLRQMPEWRRRYETALGVQ